MLKKILLTVLFVGLGTGAVYYWQNVNFSQKTERFFTVAFGDQSTMGNAAKGSRPMGENRGGAPSGQEAPAMMAQSGQKGAPPDAAQGGQPGATQQQARGQKGPTSLVSLGLVGKYTVIMAFFVMLTYLLDRWILRIKRSRRTAS